MNEELRRNLIHSRPTPRASTVMASDIVITRLRYDGDDLPQASPSKKSESFNVIMQLADFRRHRLWRDGALVFEGGHRKGTIAITDLRREWQCHHLSPFDNVRFQVPFSHLKEFAEDIGRPDFYSLRCPPGTIDTVVLGLTQAVLPALDQPQKASALFLDQINLAILAHLTETYGGVHVAGTRKGILAPWQQKRATEFLAAHLNAQFTIAELAQTCNLSRSYFIRAFKQTFGTTPYRWLIEYRIARAKDLLLSGLPISDAAVNCGFADQSHMTKVFTEVTGEPPGNWRRQNRRA